MKKSYLFSIFILMFVSLNLFSQTDKNSTSITIYNSGIGVVNEERTAELPKGISKLEITDVPKSIEPTSVHIKLNGVVFEQNFQYDLVSMSKLLEKYIDKNITVSNKEQNFSGKLLSISDNQIVISSQDGLKVFPNIENYQISVPNLPAGLLTKPTLVWKIQSSESGKQNINLSYTTSGISWDAQYVAVLNEKDDAMSFNSWVSINNQSGGTFENAQLKVIAGEPNLIPKLYTNYEDIQRATVSDESIKYAPKFEEQSFFDYHIYELNTRTTIANNETKQLSLFNVDKINVQKKYLYSNDYKLSTGGKVSSVIEFSNKKENNLGIPLPKGVVRIFKVRNNSAEFIGEDLINHTPKDENIKLKVGNAFDIIAEEKVTSEKKIADNVYERDYYINFKNHKDEDVEIEVNRVLYNNNWEIISSNQKYDKIDAYTIKFIIPVKKNKEATILYKVRFSN